MGRRSVPRMLGTLFAVAVLCAPALAEPAKPLPQGPPQVIIDNRHDGRRADYPGATFLYQFCIKTKLDDGKLIVFRRTNKGKDKEVLRLNQRSCANLLVVEGEVISAGTLSAEVEAEFRLLCINNGVGQPVCLE